MSNLEPTRSQFLVYQDEAGSIRIDVRFDDETVWLTQAQIAELFDSSKANISEHVKNVIDEGELDPARTVREFRTVRRGGAARGSPHIGLLASSLTGSSLSTTVTSWPPPARYRTSWPPNTHPLSSTSSSCASRARSNRTSTDSARGCLSEARQTTSGDDRREINNEHRRPN
jgi:hypothetical protein